MKYESNIHTFITSISSKLFTGFIYSRISFLYRETSKNIITDIPTMIIGCRYYPSFDGTFGKFNVKYKSRIFVSFNGS